MRSFNDLDDVVDFFEEKQRKRRNALLRHFVAIPANNYGLYDEGNRVKTKDDLRTLKQKIKKIKNIAAEFGVHPQDAAALKSIEWVRENKNGCCIFADSVAKVTYHEDVDWNYYGKRYNKPKVTVSNRKVTFYKGGKEVEIELESFRGDFLLKAYLQAFKVKNLVQKGRSRKIQLQDCFRAKKIQSICGVEIWVRTLGRGVYDYAAVKNDDTFHAFSKKDAIVGLKKKIRTEIKENQEIIDKSLGFALGFCEAGMMSFCEDNGLDYDSKISRKDLKDVVEKQKALNCSKYKSELKKIGVLSC
jgi:hypothetical protein